MEANELKPGDVVRLKSGGPKMTVKEPFRSAAGPRLRCRWFDGNKSMEDVFVPEELERASDPVGIA